MEFFLKNPNFHPNTLVLKDIIDSYGRISVKTNEIPHPLYRRLSMSAKRFHAERLDEVSLKRQKGNGVTRQTFKIWLSFFPLHNYGLTNNLLARNLKKYASFHLTQWILITLERALYSGSPVTTVASLCKALDTANASA
jgi:hypothetical protein